MFTQSYYSIEEFLKWEIKVLDSLIKFNDEGKKQKFKLSLALIKKIIVLVITCICNLSNAIKFVNEKIKIPISNH